MVLLKMLMEIALPKMGELLVMMMMMMISPLRGKFPWRNRSAGGQKCSCPSSASRRRRSVPKFLPLFFLGQNDLYTKRWAPAVGRGGHNPPGRAWGAWRAQVGCAHLVGPFRQLFASIILKYSIKNLRQVSACLELCRIGSLT